MMKALRNAVKSISPNYRSRYSDGRRHDTFVTTSLCSPQLELYRRCMLYRRRQSPLTLSKIRAANFCNNYSVVSGHNKMEHLALVAWRRVSQWSSHNAHPVPPINRIAQAVSLALSRSFILVPGMFVLTCRNTTSAQEPAAADPFDQTKSFIMLATDVRILLISIVLAVMEGIMLSIRAVYLAILFSPCLVMAPFADCLGIQFRKAWVQVVHSTLEKAGPAFIKWGQWAATRPDLFPRDLCNELSRLHTKAPQHGFLYTKKAIERAFGQKISDIFDYFEEAPVASGSVAQVHRASLKSQHHGRLVKPMVVAVKVRHPGVGESIRRDFEIINAIAKISKFIPTVKWLRLDESVQQFAVFMMSQVDLSREAAHLNRFIYNFRRWKDVSFPKPLYPLVHPAVLVETFEPGESVSHYVDNIEGHGRFKRALAHIGTHAFLKMLLVDNFIHADMHPGNILVRVAQRNFSRKSLFKKKPHVVFLDVGMTAELSRNDRVNLLEFFKAVACRDGHTAAECTLRLSKQQNCPHPLAFIKEVKETFDYWATPEADIFHPVECMQQLLEQVRRHKVNIDGNVCTVMVTLLVLEGWQRKLDPDYDVLHTLQTLLLRDESTVSLSYTIDGLMAP